MLTTTTDGADCPPEGVTLAELPQSWTFTSKLAPDPAFPTPASSHAASRANLGPRQVRSALFTWIRPERQREPELLAVSPAAMRDLGLKASESETQLFRDMVAGNWYPGMDGPPSNPKSGKDRSSGPTGYPWAQCYGGYQFGSWAGQLGDGRAISLFEATNPRTQTRYEVALKGAGLTPYSRFADGKAVLRSSIREFLVSEALHALGIPTTRALALTLLPHSKVVRERIEPGAIVVRFAQTWVRLGTFDLLRARGDGALIRRLATYLAEDVFGGWDKLPARLDQAAKPGRGAASGADVAPRRSVPAKEIQGPEDVEENRFARLYREIVRRNAETVAQWQAYGFVNGVLNTDNTSVLGLSIDFGPFAFMDNFDPSYTPNHDDSFLRYSYCNQPTIIWWNLVRLGEALAELIGSGGECDSPAFLQKGIPKDAKPAEPYIARAEKLIDQAGVEYKSVFLCTYKSLMTTRLGLRRFAPFDLDALVSPLLDALESCELDFHLFFRRLSSVHLAEVATESSCRDRATRFFYHDGVTGSGGPDAARDQLGAWLWQWRARILADWYPPDTDGPSSQVQTQQEQSDCQKPVQDPPISEAREQQRMTAMKRVNPNFVPRGWILEEIIGRVEKEGDRDVLKRALFMALHPFEDAWAGRKLADEAGVDYVGDRAEELRWTTDVPEANRAMQCSCSS